MASKGLQAKLPSTEPEVAARGLQVAVRMAAHKTKKTQDSVLLDLATFLNSDGRACDVYHIKTYHDRTGLPENMIGGAVEFFKRRDVKVFRHQLKPTKSVLATYGIYE